MNQEQWRELDFSRWEDVLTDCLDEELVTYGGMPDEVINVDQCGTPYFEITGGKVN